MFWADRIKEKLKNHQHVDDMFTPSGYAHVGSLRGPILHDVVYKVFRNSFPGTEYTYIFNDFDPIDGLPPELKEKFSKYLGFPTRLAPSPDGKSGSYGEFFSEDFKKVLSNLGMEARYLSSWDMYHEGKFNEGIRIALENVDKIQDIYSRVSGSRKKEKGWYPLQVICPECQKLGTTLVTGWDGSKVTFKCEENMVAWAIGCGYEGKISPFDGNAKLPWKVDWPAHWKVLGVTFEGAGKDHASKGGSYDIAFAQCEEVFNISKPFYFPYEFFLFGGKKMASSKGIGLKARELTDILPPEVARFLIVRVIPTKAIEFDPAGDTILNLFDEFDRLAEIYWEKSDTDMESIFRYSMVNGYYNNPIFLPRFRDIVGILQNRGTDIQRHFEGLKDSSLTGYEIDVLEQRIKYARIWIEKFMSSAEKNEITQNLPPGVSTLDEGQKHFLKVLSELFSEKDWDPESLQNAVFELTKRENIPAKSAFTALYVSLTGKTSGPKAGYFLTSLPKGKVLERLGEAAK